MDETGKAEFEAVACNKAVPLLICIVFGFIHQSTCIFSLEGSVETLCQMSYNIVLKRHVKNNILLISFMLFLLSE
jgi:hypothetical protein